MLSAFVESEMNINYGDSYKFPVDKVRSAVVNKASATAYRGPNPYNTKLS
jgi:hypothetical protein